MFALRDFDFELPKKSLEFKSSVSRDHAQSKFEMFDYPGRYVEPADGDKDSKKSDSDLKGSYEKFAKNRIEGHQAQYERCGGGGNARGLSVGALFTLAQYPRDDANREYLVVSATHTVEGDSYGSGGGGGTPYTCQFTVVDAKQPFRSEALTSRPYVRGPQTAIVVGKDGEEIWTDQYGRVMVQFHWDRYGESNEKSSCWVRVAQAWAGKAWGGIFIPRIGQEVIVEFLEGDPDRPIITGSVYNGDNPPPYALPANQTQSGVKSRSTKGGSEENFNEIRFEDKKDEELIYVQAEKDYEKLVKNDRSRTIGNDESLDVGNNQTEKIGASKSLSIGEDHKETIGGNKAMSIGKDHSETISGNATIDVSKNETVSVGEKMNISVGKDRSLDVGDNHSESVGKNRSVDVGKNLTRDVGEGYTVTVGKAHKETVAKGYSLEAKEIFTEAKDQIEIKVGSASLIMKKNGDIQLKGGKINIKGSGDVVIKGSKIGGN
jgi:type VI secretion system secreted protein VgrG